MKATTSPYILQKLWLRIHLITNSHAPDFGQDDDEDEKLIWSSFESQSAIGWMNLLNGQVSKAWGIANSLLIKGRKSARLDRMDD